MRLKSLYNQERIYSECHQTLCVCISFETARRPRWRHAFLQYSC